MMTAQKKITALYSAFALCVMMVCVPLMSVQNWAAILSLLVLISAYILRKKSPADSLEAHHATFVIRSLWIWSLVLILGMAGAGWVVSQNGDMAAITHLVDSVMNGAILSEDEINNAFNDYIATNYDLILKTTVMWLAPAQIYGVWRIARGMSRAWKGYRVHNPSSWF